MSFIRSIPVSCYFSRVVSKRYNIKIVHTKPGGSDYRLIRGFKFNVYTPKISDVVVFSKENLINLKSRSYSNVHLIPNRVKYKPEDLQKTFELYKEISDYEVRILRICRISFTYEKSIEQTINLANYLKSCGINAIAIIIGYVQDEEVYNNLKERSCSIFYTDSEYCTEASRLITLCELNVGVGRGFMEACSYGRVMLTTLCNSDYPVLVDGRNFDDLFETNFSPRNNLNDYSATENLNRIKKIIIDNDYERFSEKSTKWFEEFFSVDSIFEKYQQIYSLSKVQNKLSMDFYVHGIRNFKTMLVHSLKS